MNILKSLQAQVLSQMIVTESIVSNMTESLQKTILKLDPKKVIAGLALVGCGIVPAVAQTADEARNMAIAGAGVVGVITNNVKKPLPQGCENVQGINGWGVAGAGTLGALAGNQFGQGDGKTLLTALGTALLSSVAVKKENERMDSECARILADRRQQGGNYPSYNNGNSQAPILYEGRTATGHSFVVTVADSPGLAALNGQRIGSLSVDNDMVVKRGIESSFGLLNTAYINLDAQARNYIGVMQGKDSNGKLARYAVSADEIQAGEQSYRMQQIKIENAKFAFDKAFSKYSYQRSVAASIADNAAIDGYNITGYSDYLKLFVPPESTSLNQNSRPANKYAVIPGAVRP